MTDLPIVAVVKDLMDKYEVRNIITESRIKNIHEVYARFPDVAEAFLIAVEVLEKIETEDVKWSADEAKEALNRIRSLHPLPKT